MPGKSLTAYLKSTSITYAILSAIFSALTVFTCMNFGARSRKDLFLVILLASFTIISLSISLIGWFGLRNPAGKNRIRTRVESIFNNSKLASVLSLMAITGISGLIIIIFQAISHYQETYQTFPVSLFGSVLLFLVPYLFYWLVLNKGQVRSLFHSLNASVHIFLVGLFSFVSFLIIQIILAEMYPSMLRWLEDAFENKTITPGMVFTLVSLVLMVLLQMVAYLLGKRNGSINPGQASTLPKPALKSFLFSIGYFVVFFCLLQFGYNKNDDPTMISMISGYHGVYSEFLMFTNVLIGLFLKPLYQLNTGINFLVIFYIIVDFLAFRTLVHEVLSINLRRVERYLFLIVIILINTYFLLNITFTSIAAISAIAGYILVISALRSNQIHKLVPIVSGIVLIFISSLIRFEMTVSMAVVPALLVIKNNQLFDFKKLIRIFSATIILLGSAYLFEKLYIKAHPEWETFYTYESYMATLLDTPSLANAAELVEDLGWSENDYVLFSNLFFLKEPALADLGYLAKNSSVLRGTFDDVLTYYNDQIGNIGILQFILLFCSVGLGIELFNRNGKGDLSILIWVFVPMIISLVMAAIMKITAHAFIPLVTSSCLYGLFFNSWNMRKESTEDQSKNSQPGIRDWTVGLSFVFALFFSIAIITTQIFKASHANKVEQSKYVEINEELTRWAAEGVIQKDAFIFGATIWGAGQYGLPIEWSHPLKLDYPSVAYQTMGWLAYSPIFDEYLTLNDISTLPREFYKNDRVYLTTTPEWAPYIIEYIWERDQVVVDGIRIAKIPHTDLWVYQFR